MNYTAIAALIVACTALAGVILQSRRDSADEVAKRVDAACKIVKAATDLNVPLEKRVHELESDSTVLKEIVRQQSISYDKLNAKYDAVMFELRAVRSDRDNLLNERLTYQRKLDEQADVIRALELRVAELEKELLMLRQKYITK